MSAPLAAWPDVEVVLIDLLTAAGYPNNGTVTPTDFTGVTPFVRVGVYGGNDDRFTDRADVAVDVFHERPTIARDTAEAIRQLLIAYPHVLDGVVIDQVTTVSRPASALWDNTTVRRWTANYRVATRRPAS